MMQMETDVKETIRGAAARAASRDYVRRMAAQGRSLEVLRRHVLPLGIDLSSNQRPVISAIQGEPFKKPHLSL